VRAIAGLAVLAMAATLVAPQPRRAVRRLPPGVTELHAEMVVDTDLAGDPAGSTVRMASDFQGRAAIVVSTNNVRLSDFAVEGNRPARELRTGLPPYDVPFARFTTGNGILVDRASAVTIERVRFREIAGFGVLVHRGRHIAIDEVHVSDSGSRDLKGKNNTTGGILLEGGTTDFRVSNCVFGNIRGNGVWTHSLYTAPRNSHGLIVENAFEAIGRDAIQVGHAFDVQVERNAGSSIGYPRDIVDATPVAIDTAGNVERSVYAHNRFSQINGKCLDLDGFHDGEIVGNWCGDVGGFGLVMNNTNPDMQSRNIRVVGNTFDGTLYGGIFVIGYGHRVTGNRLLNVNTAHCDDCYYLRDEPDMLRSGIYLGKRAERPAPAHGNVVEDNEISGYRMAQRCVSSAPGLSGNIVRNNRCRDYHE
jgi:hypothetical protein